MRDPSRKWLLVLSLVTLTASLSLAAQTDDSGHHQSDSSHGGGHKGVHDSHEGHHGVRLASWRWSEYGIYVILCVTIILVGIFKIAFHQMHSLSNVFPESCVLIIIGIILGLVNHFSGFEKEFPQFTTVLFFNVLLPPIILDASYAIYDRSFLQNLGSVLIYAVIGTLFNVFLIGFALYGLNKVGAMGDGLGIGSNKTWATNDGVTYAELDTIQCLTFSSLISAVDPVAVLAIFQEIGVNVSLYFLVFGESLLNDGVTIVLYNTMVALGGTENPQTIEYVTAFFSFFTVVFGGLLIGILVGLLCSYILKWSEDTPDVEPLIVFVTAYFAYIFAETVHWSGIISLIGCGISQKRYGFRNMSKKSLTTVKFATKTMAGFSDAVIFLFLGVTAVRENLRWHTGFILWTCVLCLVVRFAGVLLLTALLNTARMKKISWREQFILSYGGLRGAVGFSLVEILDNTNPYKNLFVTTTLFMIAFTVFLQGGTIKLFVEKLKIRKKVAAEQLICTDVNEKTMDTMMAGVESITGGIHKHKLLESVQNFEKKNLKPCLLRNPDQDPLALKLEKITIKDHYNRLYGPTIEATKMVKQVEQENKKLERAPAQSLTDNTMRSTMRKALHASTYERFRHRTLNDSDEELADEIRKEQQDRAKMGWSNALKGVRMQIRKSRSSLDDVSENGTGGGEGGPLVGGSGKKITSMSQLVAGDRIFQLYKMNKAQFKGQSAPVDRTLTSTTTVETLNDSLGGNSKDGSDVDGETVALQPVVRNNNSSSTNGGSNTHL